MILDAHCHAWARWPYDPPVPDPDSRGRVEQLLWEMDQNGVSRAVVICAGLRDNADNNDYAASAARSSGGRLVAFADVDSPLVGIPPHGRRTRPVPWTRSTGCAPLGITHYVDEEADPDWLLGEEGDACLRLLAERGVILSLACGPLQVPAVARAAERHPTLAILLHHLGRPRAGDSAALKAVLSAGGCAEYLRQGVGLRLWRVEGWDYPYPAMQVVVRALLEGFGAERLCWGSDYPVVRRFMTYRQALEIVRSHCAFLTPDERGAVLGGTITGLLAARGRARGTTP